MSYNLSTLQKDWKIRIHELQLTQKEFCEFARVSYSTWKQMYNPPIRLLDKIEKALVRLENGRTN